MNRLPEAFEQRLQQIIPADRLPALLAALASPQATTFRVHRPNAADAEVLKQLADDDITATPLSWCDRIYTVPEARRRALTGHPLTRSGCLYIQNPSSIMPVIALDPQPGEEVMDMCAAPGGKTLCLVDAMQGEGRVATVEAVRGRFFKLRHMVQLYGANIVQCYNTDARNLWRKVPERFDRILLDAPCSSESRIRIDDPDSWKFWSPKKNSEMARKQAGLIRSAFDCLKPGGVMVYCTCTYAPEENELIVQSLLERFGEQAVIEPVALPCPNRMRGLTGWQAKVLDPQLAHAVRILPDRVQDAFFLCRIRKRPHE